MRTAAVRRVEGVEQGRANAVRTVREEHQAALLGRARHLERALAEVQARHAPRAHRNSMSPPKAGAQMDASAAARVQSSEAKSSGGGVKSGGFAARAQSAAANNANAASKGAPTKK